MLFVLMLISLGVLIASAFMPYIIMFWFGLGAYILFSILASSFHEKHARKSIFISLSAFAFMFFVKAFFVISSSISNQVMFSFLLCVAIFLIYHYIAFKSLPPTEVIAKMAVKHIIRFRRSAKNVCCLIFELEDNTTKEFHIDIKKYNHFSEGDIGILTYKEFNNSRAFINFVKSPSSVFKGNTR